MKAFITLLKIEIKMSIREFSGVLFGILIPVGLICLLGVLYKGDIRKIQLAVPGVITIGICATGLMGIPLTLSNYRSKKLLKRFQVTLTSPLLLLMVQFTLNLLISLVSSGFVMLIATLLFNYSFMGSLLNFMLLYFLVVFSIYAIGLLIASISGSINTANLLCSAVYFPMFFLSGTTIPYEIMPKTLQRVSNVLPLTHGVKVLKGISMGEHLNNFILPIMMLLSIGLICFIISIKVFKYDYE